jgi:hypothetical protein
MSTDNITPIHGDPKPPAPGEIAEEPINVIQDALGRGRAIADLIYTGSARVDELGEQTLSWALSEILDRIDEAAAAANELHAKYWALQHGHEQVRP